MKKPLFIYVVLLISIITISCSEDNSITKEEDENQEQEVQTTPNVLLIIADDMGLDATPGYILGNEKKPSTPNLTNLMANGIRYTNVWSAPLCTPTRGTIITGKHGFRTGVSRVGDVLSTTEKTLQKHIKELTDYQTAVIGKWHLGNVATKTHPNDVGVGYYAGSLSGAVRDYNSWDLTINGTSTSETSYITSKYTDLAIDWINTQDKPWFLWLAHNAPHDPYDYPPEDLYDANNLPALDGDVITEDHRKYLAMIEAMDKEIGRLLNSMDEVTRANTIILFVGDNGTGGSVSQTYNRRRVKGSVFQGGVNVPMIISGKGVSKVNAVDNSLISTVDLFATITELVTEAPADIYDSMSFASTFTGENTNEKAYIFTEIRNEDGSFDRAIRNTTHKYISKSDGAETFLYNLSENPFENPNLLSPNQTPLSTANTSQLNSLMFEMNTLLGN